MPELLGPPSEPSRGCRRRKRVAHQVGARLAPVGHNGTRTEARSRVERGRRQVRMLVGVADLQQTPTARARIEACSRHGERITIR
jgi:hypothetical protein